MPGTRHRGLSRQAVGHGPWEEGSLGPAIGPAIPSRVDAQRLNTEAGRQTNNIVLVPQQVNLGMAGVYRNSDVGLFSNRCEGGANLVLMECMACGKPVVTEFGILGTICAQAGEFVIVERADTRQVCAVLATLPG